MIAFPLGKLRHDFVSGALIEHKLENADETQFVVSLDNGRTFGFCGENDGKYSDVISQGMGMKMFVRLTRGP